MAVVILENADKYRSGVADSTDKPAFHKVDTAGDWIIVPATAKIIAILDARSGSAKVQVSNDINTIRTTGTTTSVLDWDLGNISTVQGREISEVLAVRQVIASGTSTLYVSVV